MDVRRRRPQEKSRGQVSSNAATAPLVSPDTTGFSRRIINGLFALLLSLVQVLRSLIYGRNEKQKEDDYDDGPEDKSKEEMILVGYLDKGRIAVHVRRRKRTNLVLSSSSDDAQEQSSLKHAATAYAFLGSVNHPRLLGCISAGPPIILQDAPLGTIAGFLSSNSRYPSLSHPRIPSKTAHFALPLSWLLQASSVLRFLHASKLTHGSLSPSSLLLRPDLSIAATDFTHATVNGENNGVPTRQRDEFAFPVDALRYDYFDGELSANSQALGLAIDVFDFASLAYTLLCLKRPAWNLPEGNGTWALEELHEALDEVAPELGDEIVVGYVARDCWCLVYEEGKTVMEDFVHALGRHGFSVREDEVVGVKEAVEDFAASYQANWVFEENKNVIATS